MSLLESINNPADLKRIERSEFPALAAEIRDRIIGVAARQGGHLASSLGAVELNIALHAVLDSPIDKLVWDMGYQAYAHKLITGRRDSFDQLRKRGGLMGFCNKFESEHDHFTTGHAGTACSSALGLAIARDRAGAAHRVVAVIGDASIASGLSMEALNHIGHLKPNICIILNDNGESIAESLGGLTAHLNVLTSQNGDGHAVGPIFAGLGFNYRGPIDGHDFDALLEALPAAFASDGPTLLHVRTVKGSGYEPAKREPERFHRTPAFEVDSGTPSAPPPPPGAQASFSQAFSDALCERAAADPRVVAITAAMRAGTGLKQFQQQFGDRMYDVGIAEQHAVTMAAGLATGGLRPVVAIYSTFFQRALDQVTHDVALQKLPVFFVLDRAGLVGTDGPTHHGLFDLAFLRAIPGVSLMAPKDNAEVAAMLNAAFEHNDVEATQGPIFMRLPRDRGPAPRDETAECPPIAWGKGEVLRTGDDLTIAALGSLVAPALEAADVLATQGVSCTVINARFVKPLDGQLIADHAARTRRLITIEESQTAAGFGSAVLEALAARDVRDVPVRCFGVPDQFIETAERDEQLSMVGLTPTDIVKRAQAFLRDEPDPVCEIVAAYAQGRTLR